MQDAPDTSIPAEVASSDDRLGILARRRIEAEIIKPIYQILKRDLGVDRAQAVIAEAVGGAAVEAGRTFAALEPNGTSIATFVALQVLWEKDDALDITVQREDANHFDYDVHRCSYAEMYHEMGLGEIGHLLSCARDALFIEGYDPRIGLKRTTTLMQGGPRCDFRYHLKKSKADGSRRAPMSIDMTLAPPDRVDATPYAFPLNQPLSAATTALIVIDVQGDFCAEGGYMAGFGFDLTALRKPIPAIQSLLAAARESGITVVHTRETFSADLSDVQAHRLWRGIDGKGVAVGDTGPNGRYLIKGEPCWEIIPEVAPLPGEQIFDKPSYGAFSTTDIDAFLREKGIRHLIFAGLTTDCCIHTTVREALDHGYDTLTVSDATAAGTEDVHEAALRLLVKKSGVFGAVGDTAAVLEAIRHIKRVC